jgi:hypothetical protein
MIYTCAPRNIETQIPVFAASTDFVRNLGESIRDIQLRMWNPRMTLRDTQAPANAP